MSHSKHPEGHLLQAYHDGELDKTIADGIATHCRQCATCKTELDELNRMDQMFASVQAPELPGSVWQQVKPDQSREPRFQKPLTIAACAAGLAVGILLGPIQFDTQNNVSESEFSQSVSLWNEPPTSSLLTVYQSGQE